MKKVSIEKLREHRAKTYRLSPKNRVKDPAQALEFVDERGFVFFWPIKNVDLPSLWMAVAGDRPVPNEHDDPGHITWGWKDDALGKRIWYYGKVLRRKATLISLETVPFFYALSENYGSPAEDHLIAYESGRMPLSAKLVYEAILLEGPLNTIDLRRAAGLTSSNSQSEFNRALEILQSDFKILPVGVAQAGAWRYAFIYDVTARHYPDLPEKARHVQENDARKKLVEIYFQSVGAVKMNKVAQLFGWSVDITLQIMKKFTEAGTLILGLEHPSSRGEWVAFPEIIE